MRRLAVAMTGGLLASGACAMTDPTRPPAAFDAPTASAPRAAPTLQSVIIAGNTRAAIIDGERVEVGSTVGESRVAAIAEDHVVLSQHGATEVLRLYPSIEKKSIRASALRPPMKGKQP